MFLIYINKTLDPGPLSGVRGLYLDVTIPSSIDDRRKFGNTRSCSYVYVVPGEAGALEGMEISEASEDIDKYL